MSEPRVITSVEVEYRTRVPGVPDSVTASGYHVFLRTVVNGVVNEKKLDGPFRSSQSADQAAGRFERDIADRAGRP